MWLKVRQVVVAGAPPKTLGSADYIHGTVLTVDGG
jgi:hypothetical protein